VSVLGLQVEGLFTTLNRHPRRRVRRPEAVHRL